MTSIVCCECGKEFDENEPYSMPHAFNILGTKVSWKRGVLLGKPFGMGEEIVEEIKEPHPLCANCVRFNQDGTPKFWLAGVGT